MTTAIKNTTRITKLSFVSDWTGSGMNVSGMDGASLYTVLHPGIYHSEMHSKPMVCGWICR